ncbi:unnamed protein product [Ectocarpus sp. 8 AP-2014]
MAYRELQGRLQLAEQQVRMYREAMEHLIAAPPAACTAASQPRASPISTTAGASQESLPKISAGGENDPGATKPAPGAVPDVVTTGGAKAEAVAEGHDDSVLDHERGGTKKEFPRLSSGDAEGAESSAGSTPAGKGPNIWGFIGGAVGWIGEGTAGWMAQSEAKREHHRLLEEVGKVRRRRAAVWRERELLAKTRAELARCRADLLSRRIALDSRRSDVAEARQNCRSRKALYSEQLVSAMRMAGALNDCFHIWHQGPFGTINGFRVGRLNTHVVDWQEVNAGVGQAAIVLVTVAMAMGVEFTKYLIAPCGSFTKIARSEDGRVLYSLHTDESFSLFPRRNFNFALKAFLHCLGEVGDHVQEHDPTLRLPYHIKEKEGTVGGLPVALGSSYEDWTRALKYMLTDLKWIAAWAAKYLPPC